MGNLCCPKSCCGDGCQDEDSWGRTLAWRHNNYTRAGRGDGGKREREQTYNMEIGQEIYDTDGGGATAICYLEGRGKTEEFCNTEGTRGIYGTEDIHDRGGICEWDGGSFGREGDWTPERGRLYARARSGIFEMEEEAYRVQGEYYEMEGGGGGEGKYTRGGEYNCLAIPPLAHQDSLPCFDALSTEERDISWTSEEPPAKGRTGREDTRVIPDQTWTVTDYQATVEVETDEKDEEKEERERERVFGPNTEYLFGYCYFPNSTSINAADDAAAAAASERSDETVPAAGKWEVQLGKYLNVNTDGLTLEAFGVRATVRVSPFLTLWGHNPFQVFFGVN